jgi:hypothetical protein
MFQKPIIAPASFSFVLVKYKRSLYLQSMQYFLVEEIWSLMADKVLAFPILDVQLKSQRKKSSFIHSIVDTAISIS